MQSPLLLVYIEVSVHVIYVNEYSSLWSTQLSLRSPDKQKGIFSGVKTVVNIHEKKKNLKHHDFAAELQQQAPNDVQKKSQFWVDWPPWCGLDTDGHHAKDGKEVMDSYSVHCPASAGRPSSLQV